MISPTPNEPIRKGELQQIISPKVVMIDHSLSTLPLFNDLLRTVSLFGLAIFLPVPPTQGQAKAILQMLIRPSSPILGFIVQLEASKHPKVGKLLCKFGLLCNPPREFVFIDERYLMRNPL